MEMNHMLGCLNENVFPKHSQKWKCGMCNEYIVNKLCYILFYKPSLSQYFLWLNILWMQYVFVGLILVLKLY